MRQEESGSSLFLCSNMVNTRMRNVVLYLLIILGCTWTVLHVWFWGTGRTCADCPQGMLKSSGKISGIRSVLQEMFAGGRSGGVMPGWAPWCRNKTGFLDQVMVNLTGPHIQADDPELLRVLRRHIIDPPSPNLIKMSYPLFKTPQAEAVEKLTKGKVSEVDVTARSITIMASWFVICVMKMGNITPKVGIKAISLTVSEC